MKDYQQKSYIKLPDRLQAPNGWNQGKAGASTLGTNHSQNKPVINLAWSWISFLSKGLFFESTSTFRAQKAVLCLLCLHSRKVSTILKMIRWKAKLTSLWARNCTTIWQVLISKFAFGPEKLPGLLRKGSLVLLSFMRDKENSGLTWEWILLTRSLHYREFSTVRVGIVQTSLLDQYKYPQQSNQYHGRDRKRRFNIFCVTNNVIVKLSHGTKYLVNYVHTAPDILVENSCI